MSDRAAPAQGAIDRRTHIRRRGHLTRAQRRALDDAADKYRLRDFNALTPPIMVEVGFGAGHALAEFAAGHSDWQCVGIELYQPGIGALTLQCEARGLANVWLVEDNARVVLPSWPAASVRFLAIYFPDPWPKVRHHKRRLVQPDFVRELTRVLEAGGRLALATDWEHYARQMLAVCDAEPTLVNEAGAGRFSRRAAAARPATRFEQRGLKLGHAIRDLLYRKRGSAP